MSIYIYLDTKCTTDKQIMAQHTDPLPSYIYLPISQEEIVQDGHQNTHSDLDQLMAIAAMVANERRSQTEVAWNERLDRELETMSCANSEASVEQNKIEDELARLTSGSSKQKKKVNVFSCTIVVCHFQSAVMALESHS